MDRTMKVLLYFVTINFFNVHLIESYKTKIYVDLINGKDIKDCRSGKSKTPCKTLDYALQSLKPSTKIFLTEGTHYLKKPFRLEKLNDISISGIGISQSVTQNTIINCNGTLSGLTFIRSSNISLSSLTVTKCAVEHLSTTVQHPKMKVALFFVYVQHVSFNWVYIMDNYGFGVTMYDVNGNVTFNNVIFANNSDQMQSKFPIHSKHDKTTNVNGTFKSGGGIYIEFTSCGGLHPFDCSNIKEQQFYNHDADYKFYSCYFYNNTAEHSQRAPMDYVQGKDHVSFGRGGGLSIFAKGNATNNNFSIKKSIFRFNKALWGAGYSANFLDAAYSCKIHVYNCLFEYNVATFGGGGVRIYSLLNTTKLNKQLKVFHVLNQFYWNSAVWGGGFSAVVPIFALTKNDMLNPYITFRDSLFLNNKATVGSAIGLTKHDFTALSLVSGLGIAVHLYNCTVSNNQNILSEDEKVIGQGAIYVNGVILKLSDRILMERNTGTAIVLDSSVLVVADHVTLQDNVGIEGGALALYGNSFIILIKGVLLQLLRNEATRRGGAIFFQISGPHRVAFQATELLSDDCFFQYFGDEGFNPDKWDCSVKFYNNSAPPSKGNSIFASTLQYCRLPGEARNNTRAFNWTNGPFEYMNIDNSQPEIVTDAINIHVDPHDWMIGPNIPFSPSVILKDELQNDVYGSIELQIFKSENSTSNIGLVPASPLFLVKDKIRDIRLVGKEGNPYKINISTSDGQTIVTPTYNVLLTKCPVGYYQKPGTNKCVCLGNFKDSRVLRCDDNGTIYILKGTYGAPSNYSKYGFITTECPRGYCRCQQGNNLIANNYECLYIPHTTDICAPNREGPLCGQCIEGYSVRLWDEKCAQCTNKSAFLIIPMLLIASFFVITVMYFNLDFFAGYLNAFFYSYQVISLMRVENSVQDPVIGVIIGFTSLTGTGGNFGFCFVYGFTDFYKLLFYFIFPIYLIVFTFIFGRIVSAKTFVRLLMCKRKPTDNDFGQLTQEGAQKKSFGRALSFLSVFCYFIITDLTLKLLHAVEVDGEPVLYNAGSIKYFGKEHLIPGLFAIFCAFFIVLGFPIFILLSPKLVKRFSTIQHIDPLVEALKCCYDENRNLRWFAAFYFIARLLLMVIAFFIEQDIPRFVMLALASILIQMVFNWFKPYKKWISNLLDTILLANLSIICLLSLILSVPYVGTDGTQTFIKYFQHVLAYVPLLTLAYHVLHYYFHEKRLEQQECNQCRPRVRYPARAAETNSNREDGLRKRLCVNSDSE